MFDLNKFIRERHGKIENGRLRLECRCDGTYAFMYEMLEVLKGIGCTDIQRGEYMLDNTEPPWMDCVYWCSGKLPEGDE